jgi:adenylate cyclase
MATTSTAGIHQTLLPLTILFADIAGSTRLYEALGDKAARKIVSKAMALLLEVIGRHEGTLVKTIGDEIMCTFAQCSSAARASVEMQQELKRAIASRELDVPKLGIRVGFHYGPVIREKGDVFGDAVNMAARIVGQAKTHQVLTSRQTCELLETDIRKSARFIDQVAVKGKIEELELFELIWDLENVTLVEAPSPDLQRGGGSLLLRYHDHTVEFDPSRLSLTIGRGEGSDIVLADVLASRLHARIELRRDRFVFIDQSINGTYIQIYGTSELYVRRDETILQGSGMISPARPCDGNTSEVIHFTCEEK